MRHLVPDVVLMDIRVPGLDGLEVTRLLMADPRTSNCKVIALTTFDLDEYVSAALALGAYGFVVKRSGPALLTEAIRAAVNGDMFFIAVGTVKTHVANIAAKLGARNRVGIAAWAWEHGIAQPQDYI